MAWTPARFYRPEGGRLCCTLCPHACRLLDGEVGVCQVRRRTGERLETAMLTTAVRHLGPIERKPFFHFRPGRKVLTVSGPGCTFRCHYCQNYRLSQFGRTDAISWRGEPLDLEATLTEAAAQQALVGLSYAEPTLAAELTLALAEARTVLPHPIAPEEGLGGVEIVWKSNGFITSEALRQVAPALAAVNIDLKAADERRHQALTGASLKPVLRALEGFLAAGVWVEVSTPLIPRINTDPQSIRWMAETLVRLDPEIPWHLLRFSPEFRMRRSRPTAPEVLENAVEIAREAGLHHIYVERSLGDAGRTTYCPGCGDALISRDVWHTRSNRLDGGSCPNCGRRIAGRWSLNGS